MGWTLRVGLPPRATALLGRLAMSSDVETLIGKIEASRARLVAVLHGDPAYRALDQLSQREEAGNPLEAVSAVKLRERLIGELAGNRTFMALRKLEEALQLLQARTDRNPAGFSQPDVALPVSDPIQLAVSAAVAAAEELAMPELSAPRRPSAAVVPPLVVPAASPAPVAVEPRKVGLVRRLVRALTGS